jgi:glycosyltransferase involved in cell wall biosynthesis
VINLKITVGIPAFNEEKNIASIIQKLSQVADTVIVCDDGSTDNTAKIAEKMGAIVITHQQTLGYGGAIRSLFLKARELDSDMLVTLDSDGQHRISDVLPIVDPIIKNQADLVIGSRFLTENQKDMPKYRKIGIKMITKLANTSLEESVTDSQSGFRAYGRNILSKITPSEKGMGVSNEILMKVSKTGFKIVEVPIVVSYEGNTSTQHPVSHGASVTMSTLKFISIENPLKFYGIPGLVFLAIGLIFTIMTIQGFSETRQILLGPAIIGVGTIVFGTVLLMTSIILFSIVNVIREKN